MSNYVNLLDIIYPVNSVYITTSAVSPATSIGGTWTQIEGGACIAAYDSVSGYQGSHTISINQMPSHQHSSPVWLYTDNGDWRNAEDNVPATCRQVTDKNSCIKINYDTNMNPTGGGQDYYPYSYACRVYIRTA